MNKSKFTEISNEQLLKNEKSLKVVTYMLGGSVSVLFVINIFLAFMSGFSALQVIPIALVPILIINLNTLKEMKKEIKSRNL